MGKKLIFFANSLPKPHTLYPESLIFFHAYGKKTIIFLSFGFFLDLWFRVKEEEFYHGVTRSFTEGKEDEGRGDCQEAGGSYK